MRVIAVTRLLLAVGLIKAQKGKRTCSTEILDESYISSVSGYSDVGDKWMLVT